MGAELSADLANDGATQPTAPSLPRVSHPQHQAAARRSSAMGLAMLTPLSPSAAAAASAASPSTPSKLRSASVILPSSPYSSAQPPPLPLRLHIKPPGGGGSTGGAAASGASAAFASSPPRSLALAATSAGTIAALSPVPSLSSLPIAVPSTDEPQSPKPISRLRAADGQSMDSERCLSRIVSFLSWSDVARMAGCSKFTLAISQRHFSLPLFQPVRLPDRHLPAFVASRIGSHCRHVHLYESLSPESITALRTLKHLSNVEVHTETLPVASEAFAIDTLLDGAMEFVTDVFRFVAAQFGSSDRADERKPETPKVAPGSPPPTRGQDVTSSPKQNGLSPRGVSSPRSASGNKLEDSPPALPAGITEDQLVALFAPPAPTGIKKLLFIGCDSVGAAAIDALHLLPNLEFLAILACPHIRFEQLDEISRLRQINFLQFHPHPQREKEES